MFGIVHFIIYGFIFPPWKFKAKNAKKPHQKHFACWSPGK